MSELESVSMSQRIVLRDMFLPEQVEAGLQGRTNVRLVPLTAEMLKELVERTLPLSEFIAIPRLVHVLLSGEPTTQRHYYKALSLSASLQRRGKLWTVTTFTPDGDAFYRESGVYAVVSMKNETEFMETLATSKGQLFIDLDRLGDFVDIRPPLEPGRHR